MSSTSTWFQPQIHNVAHIYGHRETQTQQLYANNQYWVDPGSPSDSTDSYTQSDRATYTHVSSRSGSSFEDTEEALRLGYAQNTRSETVNSSTQLLCPRPTIPPSSFSPTQFSGYDWPSPASTNNYQAYSEQNTSEPQHYTSPVSNQPMHPVTPPSSSLEDQQMTSNYYPAMQEELAETVPSPISPHHHNLVGTVYIEPPLSESVSSFERGQNHLTYTADMQSRYYAAHQPVLPEQRSTYSELAANLKFMNDQLTVTAKIPVVQPGSTKSQDNPAQTRKRKRDTTSKPKSSVLDTKKYPYALGLDGPPLTAANRKFGLPPPLPPLRSRSRSRPVGDSSSIPTPPASSQTPPPPRDSIKTGKVGSSRTINEPRRPSLACTFCRERKIACGRPPDDSPDPTCNQCARRSFRCRYVDLKSARASKALASSMTRM